MFFIGNAVVFLLPQEDSYVEFISINQKVTKYVLIGWCGHFSYDGSLLLIPVP
jgi:hypothetical protein